MKMVQMTKSKHYKMIKKGKQQMGTESLISNFDYLIRVFDIQAFNEHGERILSDNEIIELILPYYLSVDLMCQYAIGVSLVGIRKMDKFCAKIQELINKKEINGWQ